MAPPTFTDPAPARNLAPVLERTGLLGVLEHSVRTLGVGYLFACFGILSVVVAFGLLPLIALFRRGEDRTARELRAQLVIHRIFRRYIRMGCAIGVFGFDQSGTEHLGRGAGLIVANHPALLDVVYLISCTPQADCVVKREVFENWFLRGIARAAGYIPNEGGVALVESCAERLRAGRSVILFPEGSRSPVKGLGAFKRGAARIALASGCRITPVTITCDPPALKRSQPWYRQPNRRLWCFLDVGESVDAKQLAGDAPTPAIAARRVTAALRAYFEARIGGGDPGEVA